MFFEFILVLACGASFIMLVKASGTGFIGLLALTLVLLFSIVVIGYMIFSKTENK